MDEVKIAVGIAAGEIVDPAEGVANGGVGRGKGGPAKVKNVAAQDERIGVGGGGVDGCFVPRGLRAARAEVEVGDEVGLFHNNAAMVWAVVR